VKDNEEKEKRAEPAPGIFRLTDCNLDHRKRGQVQREIACSGLTSLTGA